MCLRCMQRLKIFVRFKLRKSNFKPCDNFFAITQNFHSHHSTATNFGMHNFVYKLFSPDKIEVSQITLGPAVFWKLSISMSFRKWWPFPRLGKNNPFYFFLDKNGIHGKTQSFLGWFLLNFCGKQSVSERKKNSISA